MSPSVKVALKGVLLAAVVVYGYKSGLRPILIRAPEAVAYPPD